MYQSGYLESELFLDGFVDSHIWNVEPSVEYYVDFNAVATGVGTEISPWNLAQVKSYFNYEAGYYPKNGDIVNIKGDIIVSSIDEYVFLFNFGDHKTITIRAWDKPANGLYTISTTNSGMCIFKFDASIDYSSVNIYDCAIFSTGAAGPDPSELKLTERYSSYGYVVFGNCVIISEDSFNINGMSIYIAGSTVSVGGSCVLTTSGDIIFSNSAVNISDTASVVNGLGALSWSYGEFNTDTSSVPGTKYNCVFDNESLEELPTAIGYDDFMENDFNYYIYKITNTENPVPPWYVEDLTDDIMGGERVGIGAFRFAANTYYVDGEKEFSGNGTESDQFTFNQFRNYFCSTVGSECGIEPTGYDTFLMKNIFVPIDSFFLRITDEIGGYVIVRAASISENKAWFIETKESEIPS
jgi:hypothetical protein